MTQFEDLHFDNRNELQAIVSSLPKAEYRANFKSKQPITKEEGKTKIDISDKDVTPELEPEEESVHIVNQETGESVSTPSNKYDLIQHQDAFQPILEAMNDLGLNVEGRVRKVNKGNYVNIEARFKGKEFKINGDSDYMQGFFFRNSFNSGSSVGLEAFYERQVCSNGMVIQKNVIPALNRKHIGNAELVERYKEWFTELLQEVEVLQERLMEAREERLEIEKALVNANLPGREQSVKERIEKQTGMVNRKELYDTITRMIEEEVEAQSSPETYRRYQKAAEKILFNSKNQLEQEIEVER